MDGRMDGVMAWGVGKRHSCFLPLSFVISYVLQIRVGQAGERSSPVPPEDCTYYSHIPHAINDSSYKCPH